jgi:hypothetical protein
MKTSTLLVEMFTVMLAIVILVSDLIILASCCRLVERQYNHTALETPNKRLRVRGQQKQQTIHGKGTYTQKWRGRPCTARL